jgi:hypothetical protein
MNILSNDNSCSPNIKAAAVGIVLLALRKVTEIENRLTQCVALSPPRSRQKVSKKSPGNSPSPRYIVFE